MSSAQEIDARYIQFFTSAVNDLPQTSQDEMSKFQELHYDILKVNERYESLVANLKSLSEDSEEYKALVQTLTDLLLQSQKLQTKRWLLSLRASEIMDNAKRSLDSLKRQKNDPIKEQKTATSPLDLNKARKVLSGTISSGGNNNHNNRERVKRAVKPSPYHSDVYEYHTDSYEVDFLKKRKRLSVMSQSMRSSSPFDTDISRMTVSQKFVAGKSNFNSVSHIRQTSSLHLQPRTGVNTQLIQRKPGTYFGTKQQGISANYNRFRPNLNYVRKKPPQKKIKEDPASCTPLPLIEKRETPVTTRPTDNHLSQNGKTVSAFATREQKVISRSGIITDIPIKQEIEKANVTPSTKKGTGMGVPAKVMQKSGEQLRANKQAFFPKVDARRKITPTVNNGKSPLLGKIVPKANVTVKRKFNRQNSSSSMSSTTTKSTISKPVKPAVSSSEDESIAQGIRKASKKLKSRGSDVTKTSAKPSAHNVVKGEAEEDRYCVCSEVSYGEMVACDNVQCEIEWFHFKCVKLVTKPKGNWFCPGCRGERSNVARQDLKKKSGKK